MSSSSSRTRLLALLLAAFLLSGLATACGNAEAATGPPDINYGRDVCIECGMVISEARFAAAYRLDDGTEKKFDDVGGMLKHGRENNEMAGAVAWVHDFTTEEWVEAEAAFYVPTRSVATPMAHGIVAFADHDRAMDFAAGVGGEVIDWETVLLLPVVDGLVGHHHDMSTDSAVGDTGMDHEGMDNDEMNHEGADGDDMDHEEMNHDMEGEA